MNIELSQKEYAALCQLVNLGHYMVNGIRTEPVKEYDDLEQKIYSKAKDAGVDGIEYDEELKGYYPTQEWEDELQEYIVEYEDIVFWEELSERLAKRDLLVEYSDREIESMHEDEYLDKLFEIEAEYTEIFEEDGIKNLVVQE